MPAIDQFFQPFFLLKILILIMIFIYFIFTFVILNQVNTMNRIITEAHSSPILYFIALLNLFIAISLFFFVLVIL
ncbi:MAG: hypothetical protein Q8P80_02110 [Candidatus Levybacteria bacterium]|nr:hypothetical protein [Candidatus Levybacteria bacterium]